MRARSLLIVCIITIFDVTACSAHWKERKIVNDSTKLAKAEITNTQVDIYSRPIYILFQMANFYQYSIIAVAYYIVY